MAPPALIPSAPIARIPCSWRVLRSEGARCVDAVVGAGGDLVGRGAAGGRARAAGGSCRAGPAAVGFAVARADRRALAARAGRDEAVGDRGRAADDRDGDVRAVDGAQGPSWLGIPDAGRGGLGFDSPAALLPDRVV